MGFKAKSGGGYGNYRKSRGNRFPTHTTITTKKEKEIRIFNYPITSSTETSTETITPSPKEIEKEKNTSTTVGVKLSAGITGEVSATPEVKRETNEKEKIISSEPPEKEKTFKQKERPLKKKALRKPAKKMGMV